MVYITPARTSEYRGGRVSWCDGLLWNSSAPACVVPEAGARTTCGWDDVDVDPWCGWSQRSASGPGRYASKYDNHQYSRSDDDDFDWTITDQPTPTLNTGPSAAWAGSKEGPLLTESFEY